MIKAWRKHISPFIIIVASTLAFFALTSFWRREPAADKQAELAAAAAAYKGRRLPRTPLLELKSGDDYFERVSGGDVLLIYLMRGCDACEKELQAIAESRSAINPELKIYGVTFEGQEAAGLYTQNQNINFPILLDKDGRLFKELGPKYFPSNFRLSGGLIKEAWFGLSDEREDFLNRLNARMD